MNKHLKNTILSFFVLLFPLVGFSQNSGTKAPKYSNEFLSIGIGARSQGMAKSTIASVNDPTATYWNPAALTRSPHDLQLGLMHSEYFADIGKFDYGGVTKKLSDSASVGVTVIRFGVDNIPNTLDLIDNDGNIRYDRIKTFSVADYAFLFSYAKISARFDGLRYGGNAKVVYRKAGDFATAWGFGIDLSALYEKGNWQLGAMARDVSTTFNAWSYNTEELEATFLMTGNEIPENTVEITLPKLLLGASYNFTINEKVHALAELDLDVTFDGKRNVLIKSDPICADPHLGFEVDYKNIFYVRGGVGNAQKIPGFDGKDDFTFQPNIGLGINLKRISLDYAYTDIGDQSIALYSHVISLTISIDKQPIK